MRRASSKGALWHLQLPSWSFSDPSGLWSPNIRQSSSSSRRGLTTSPTTSKGDAREAVLAYRTLKGHLEAAGLKINSDKTGFITSSKEPAKALDSNLQPGDPKHHNVLRDLGIDATNSIHPVMTWMLGRPSKWVSSPKTATDQSDGRQRSSFAEIRVSRCRLRHASRQA